MDICKYSKCTGCAACINACPQKCIHMKEDEYGEIHPVVDLTLCKQCGLCKKSCPNNIELTYNYPSHCYASWITDSAKRQICASGGIATIMSEYVISFRHGVVFGTAYDSEMTPRVSFVETLDGLEAFKGSKYVQSIIGEETFRDVKRFIKQNRLVLFIGTPCQIAGLKSYLCQDYDNLVTVDLICHGVCPTKYFKEEVNYLVDKCNITDLADVRFRGNDDNNYRLTLWENNKNGKFKRKYKGNKMQNYYLAGFLFGVSMRENCYSCNYARPDRVSDITIGDFIGLGKTIPFNYSKRNVSSVMINTNIGNDFYEAVSNSMHDFKNIERDYSERLVYKPSLMEPLERHHLNSKFREYYLKYGYLKAIRKTLWRTMFYGRILHRLTWLKKMMFK